MSASLLHHLTGLGGFTIGQILMTPIEGGRFELRHTDDAALSVGDLESFSDPLSARQIAHYNAAGEYRPLKGTPDLRTGWRLELNGAEALRTALDTFYPAALALWTAHRENRLRVLPLSETLDRQTGMYRYARTISPEGAEGLTNVAAGKDVPANLSGRTGPTPFPRNRVSFPCFARRHAASLWRKLATLRKQSSRQRRRSRSRNPRNELYQMCEKRLRSLTALYYFVALVVC